MPATLNFSINGQKVFPNLDALEGRAPSFAHEISVQEGIIVLVDISGFTKFVKQIDPHVGVHVIHELLNTIITQNEFELHVNEIEGDAVLFYKIGQPLTMRQIIHQFESMSASFHEKLTSFNPVLREHNLSLKMIVHYGAFSVYQIDGFTKLYGIPVIEAHRLLKNSIGGNHYLLVTQEYLKVAGEDLEDSPYTLQLCEIYEDVGALCYHFLTRIK